MHQKSSNNNKEVWRNCPNKVKGLADELLYLFIPSSFSAGYFKFYLENIFFQMFYCSATLK